MKKLTVEEASNELVVKKNTSLLNNMLMQLQPGEALIIEKGKDWKSKSAPYRIVRYLEQKTKRKFDYGKTTDGKGWIVKRIS